MAITLAASVNNGVYRVGDYEMAQEGGEYLKTKYFYDALNALDQDDNVIYACFDTYGNTVDKEIFDKIELEYGIMKTNKQSPGRPSIPDDEKNILVTFSLKRWQVQRLKATKNKSKLIQYLLTKHFTSLP